MGTPYRLSHASAVSIVVFPVIVASVFATLFWADGTRLQAVWMIKENRPVQLATFATLLAASLLGLLLAWRLGRHGAGFWVTAFYAVFALGSLVTAMEEVAWGQWFFGFETPFNVWQINRQRELTLHNIPPFHRNTVWFRTAFALGGLTGLALSRLPRFRMVAVPPVLWSWFIVIALLAGTDFYLDHNSVNVYFDKIMGLYMSEVVEMLIGMAGFLYVWLNFRKLSAARKSG